ncbi:MAG: hypothetical protein IPK68_04050 [Bdellovibrionales bacterium]|nr:hypothetical protein [Bdellovibrionales bacterium]
MKQTFHLPVSTKFWKYPLLGSLLIVAGGLCIFSQTAWGNLSTIVGVAFTLLGVWLTLKIFEFGNQFNTQLDKAVQTVQTITLTSLKLQFLDNLRNLYESAEKDSSARKYWHFIWRFESFDQLSLHLQPEGTGHIRVQILGSNNDPLLVGFEGKEQQIYTVEVLDADDTTAFTANDEAYCTHIDGKSYISKNANEIELLEPIHQFLIVGLGRMQARSVGDRIPKHKRLKDISKLE